MKFNGGEDEFENPLNCTSEIIKFCEIMLQETNDKIEYILKKLMKLQWM